MWTGKRFYVVSVVSSDWLELEPEVVTVKNKEPWQAKVKKLEILKATYQRSVYDRAVLLKEVHEDPDFLAEYAGRTRERNDYIKSLVDDLAVSPQDLFMMLGHFPHRKDWSDRDMPLSKMRQIALRCQNEKKVVERAASTASEAEEGSKTRLGYKSRFEALGDALFTVCEAYQTTRLPVPETLADAIESAEVILKHHDAETRKKSEPRNWPE